MWRVSGALFRRRHNDLVKRLNFHKIEPAILHMKDKFKAGCFVLETAGVGLAIGNALVKREGARSSRFNCSIMSDDRRSEMGSDMMPPPFRDSPGPIGPST